MSTNTRYFICVELPSGIDRQILALRKRHQGQSWQPKVPTHVTLLRPGRATVNTATAERQFQRLRRTVHTIILRSVGIGSFRYDGDLYAVYLKLWRDHNLFNIHELLLEHADSFMEVPDDGEDGFQPHITLAGKVPDTDQLAAILSDLEPRAPQLSVRIDRMALYKRADDDPVWVKLVDRAM